MKQIVALALIAAIASSCNGKPDTTATLGQNGTDDPVLSTPNKDNVGDLEQAVIIEAAVAQKSQGANVQATPLVDPRGSMNLLTVDVTPPLPEELWLDITVKSRRSFPKNPGVLRIAIKDGDHVLDSFGTVIGNNAKPSVSERSVNVLAARDTIPDTMLVTIEVEALLMPEGTDPDSIDPVTAETPESRYSRAVPTPPIRVNFEGAAAQPPAEPAMETPEDDEGAEGEAPAEVPAPTAEGV